LGNSLVVGGAGFIGSWLVEVLLKESSSEIFIVDNLLSSEKANISKDPRVNFIEGSASRSDVLEKVDSSVESIFHLACYHGNQSSIVDPIADLENNLKPTISVLTWAEKKFPKARIVYSGAGCAVAPKTWNQPTGVLEVDETSILHDSPYSISKIAGEMYSKYYADRRGLDVVRVRFQNAYGPKEILGAGLWRGTSDTIWRNVIPTFIWKALKNEDLILHEGGKSSRDFVFAEDLAKGLLSASRSGKKGEVYNLASGREYLIQEVASLIVDLTGSSSKLIFEGRRDWDHSGRRFGDPSKAKRDLEFSASTDFITGIKRTIEWTKSNTILIENSISKHKNEIIK
jgi:nucleoside-diphosphate-sugar epimerase